MRSLLEKYNSFTFAAKQPGTAHQRHTFVPVSTLCAHTLYIFQ